MKAKSIIGLLLTLVITVGLVFGVYNGLTLFGKQIIPGADAMRMGLDIAGGVRIVYKPDVEEVPADGLSVAERILRTRLDQKGLNEATVAIDETNPETPMLVVEIPGFTDPKEASDFLGKTAKLQFIEPDGTVVIEGEDIVSANAAYGQISELGGNEHHVSVTISNEAVKKFSEATTRLSKIPGSYISIVLDGNEISSPTVQVPINEPGLSISGNFTSESAKELAELIASGALPFGLVIENQEYIGPTIGHQAFDVTLKAGAVAFILIALFLIFVYRVPGIVTVINLVLYAAIFVLIHQWGDITITLPGIAGIILTLAMAVDASIIIYERFREEIKAGKTLKTSVDLSFSRAFSAISDSNITTIISGAILWVFGTGPVKGFAIALVVGTILSFLMSMVVLRFMMKWTANIITKPNKHIYGI